MTYKINIKGEFNLENADSLKNIKDSFKELNNILISSDEKVAYYYEAMETRTILSYNSEILFYAASTIKILVCLLLLEQAENEIINLDEKLLITMDDIKQGTGIIKNQNKDTYYTIRDLIKNTLVESDNTAYIKLVNYIGKENIIEYGKKLGAKHTLEGNDLFGLINCDDMVIYWKKVKEFIETKSLGNELLRYLKNPSFSIIEKENIGNNVFIKKYGSFEIAYHECGIVQNKFPYYLIILTQKGICENKKEFVNDIAKRINSIHELIHSNLTVNK